MKCCTQEYHAKISYKNCHAKHVIQNVSCRMYRAKIFMWNALCKICYAKYVMQNLLHIMYCVEHMNTHQFFWILICFVMNGYNFIQYFKFYPSKVNFPSTIGNMSLSISLKKTSMFFFQWMVVIVSREYCYVVVFMVLRHLSRLFHLQVSSPSVCNGS